MGKGQAVVFFQQVFLQHAKLKYNIKIYRLVLTDAVASAFERY